VILLVVKRLLHVVQKDGEEQNLGVRFGIGRHDDVRVPRHPQQMVHPTCYRLFRFLDQVTNAFLDQAQEPGVPWSERHVVLIG
jgi:hypothetical protein